MPDAAAFTPPAELRASRPAELRGLRRDGVRMMVIDRSTGAIAHARFDQIGDFLETADLLVVNGSRTLPAAVPAQLEDGRSVEVRLCVRRPQSWDVLLVEPFPPHRNVPAHDGEAIILAGEAAGKLDGRRADIPLLWRLQLDGDPFPAMLRAGRPIRYSYVPEPVPLDYYQTVFSSRPGSAETPSAGRAFSWELLIRLRRAGVATTAVVLHTGLSSFQDDAFDAEHHLFEEWFEVSAATAARINRAQRVIAVGTTVVRALETAASSRGTVRAMRGWTSLKITSSTQLRVVDALLTGFHEPQASHFDLLRAFLDEPLLDRAYGEAIERRYLWHEFGDTMLIV